MRCKIRIQLSGGQLDIAFYIFLELPSGRCQIPIANEPPTCRRPGTARSSHAVGGQGGALWTSRSRIPSPASAAIPVSRSNEALLIERCGVRTWTAKVGQESTEEDRAHKPTFRTFILHDLKRRER